MKTKTEIRVCKEKIIPKLTEDQKNKIRIRCSQLYGNLQTKSCIIDDESYFMLAHSTINNNDNSYSSDVCKTPEKVKYQPKSKFEQKLLVWVCFSECGLSKPFFVSSGLAINHHIYLEECI